MHQRCHLSSRTTGFILYFLATLFLFCSLSLQAAVNDRQPHTNEIPVWLYDEESFSFWHDAQGNYQGFYPELIRTINSKYGYNLQIHPIQGNEISQRFNSDSYGIYADVINTEERARTKWLSSRLFDIDVVAASLTTKTSNPETLNHARVIFRQNDATWDHVHQRYPELHFGSVTWVANSEQAFKLLNENKADFYINDTSEMENTDRYYLISHPFPELRVHIVLAFSPEVRVMRENINKLINEWQNSGEMDRVLRESKQRYLLSRLAVKPDEQEWIKQHHLQILLPKNGNFAPLLWQDEKGYHGSVIDMINDMKELLHIKVDMQFVDDYVMRLKEEKWQIRMVDLLDGSAPLPEGMIGPTMGLNNAYYNQAGQPFLWDEEQARHQRIGVLQGSFAVWHLQYRFGTDITILALPSVPQLIDALENKKVDYILGNINSMESILRGNELSHGTLKVAGLPSQNYQIGPWVDSTHPLHSLLTRIYRLSGDRTELERYTAPLHIPDLTKNTFKIISIVLLITACFSLCLMFLMWRHIKRSRLLSRNIVKAMEKVNCAHDDETGSHIKRVSRYCAIFAHELGLPNKTVKEIESFASLHDIGKIAIPEKILRKQGPLTSEEFGEIKRHTIKGWRIIQGLELGEVAENIIHFHHEKWDGSGYPEGLRGEQIPIEARIMAIADVYDALRQKRIYKPGFSHERTCEVILAGEGRHFDPQLIDLFRRHHQRLCHIYDSLAD